MIFVFVLFLKKIKKSFRWYRFDVPRANQDLIITVTPFSGDPDLYVMLDRGDGQRPNREHYDWRSLTSGADVLIVQV